MSGVLVRGGLAPGASAGHWLKTAEKHAAGHPPAAAAAAMVDDCVQDHL
jgi:hypothetical protein